MSQSARELLRQKLSPVAFENLRIARWYYLSHLTGIATTFRGHPAPVLHSFPEAGGSRLREEISGINIFVPTAMCRAMARHGSDKSTKHNYTTLYSMLFQELRKKPLRILELGLGTNNPDLVSTMGVYGRPGASMRGWRELFPNALIYGADIDRDILFNDHHIETFYCDQLDAGAIRDLWAQPSLRQEMDIIIDDGLHTLDGNVSFMNGSLEHLRPGGLYIVEDILSSAIEGWQTLLRSGYTERFPNHEFLLIELPHTWNRHDNNLLMVRKNV